MSNVISTQIRAACRAAIYGSASLLALTPMALILTPSMARAETISGTVPSVVRSVAGQKGNDGTGDGQAGGPGHTPDDVSVELSNTAVVGSGGVQLNSSGGAGGEGNGASGVDKNGGAGGAGAPGSSVTLTLDAGSQVDSSVSTGGIAMQSSGGNGGGYGNPPNYGAAGAPGAGAAGGTLNYSQAAGSKVTSTYGGAAAVSMTSTGSTGADAGSAQTLLDDAHAAAGAAGGGGGAINSGSPISGTITSAGSGVVAISQGGDGGAGGSADGANGTSGAHGGSGGAGGWGGSILLNFSDALITATGATARSTGDNVDLGGGASLTLSAVSAGVMARSTGGTGNEGGTAVGKHDGTFPGAGGTAGDGGTVSLYVVGGEVQTSGYGSVGVLAQSTGGAGGNGAASQGFFRARSGGGGPGGDGNAATILLANDNNGLPAVITKGEDSDAVVAQSIGGGGGYGGDVNATGLNVTVAIGGIGGTGGESGAVTVDNGAAGMGTNGITISTHGENSTAITAQSIAGGGGRGGDAFATTIGGYASVSIGGSGGTGGDASEAVVENNHGVIQTVGSRSYGILAQSIGGGGGVGGSAHSFTAGLQATVAVAIGGSGGTGGSAADVVVTNGGQIATAGSDSYGILAQSIGGGGGAGGSSLAATYQGNDQEFPSIDMKVSVGGAGGSAPSTSSSALVTVTNNGYVWTQGLSATGILAQSIAGGGGAGGDAGTKGDEFNASTINVDTAIGGSGAIGGGAGGVNVTNNGLIVTLADMADGIDAESIGGGGGNGGYGRSDSGTLVSGDNVTLKVAVSVGGSGGSGGTGGNVNVTNTQGILTRGNSANGIFASSIGGGGGNGGAAIANGSGGKITVDVGVGGSGGSGNTSGTVTVNNSGGIATAGGSANAIFAQSVGGGGGTGGNGSTSGSTDPETSAFNFIAGGAGVGANVVQTADGIYAIKDALWGDFDIVPKLQQILLGYDGSNTGAKLPQPAETTNDNWNISVGGGIGGSGGHANNGNLVTVSNTGNMLTAGPDAAGILAQSIGGGGGTGGASDVESPTSFKDPGNPGIFVGVGGGGGNGGNGGVVQVSNTATIQTSGDASFGIEAQSIGGGGGNGGISTTHGGTITDVTMALGGDGGVLGSGNEVDVTFNPAAAKNNITTTGGDAIGIVAQSVGAGGGVQKMLSVAVSDGGQAGPSQSTLPSLNIVNLRLNGEGGAHGVGGVVNVKLGTSIGPYGYVQTSGQNAYGVLAQSIGGGGGLQVGIGTASTPATALQDMLKGNAGASVSGDGGTINVTLDNLFNIGTYGAGAAGIFAQSIGGSGGIFGGLSYVDLSQAPQATPADSNRKGQGGDINITVTGAAAVAARGVNAPAILAQALGGGGGMLGAADGSGVVFAGATSYSGCAPDCHGNVTVTVQDGSVAEAFGKGGYGIYAQSLGNGTGASNVTVHVGAGSFVRAIDQAAAAILVDGQDGNTVTVDAGGTVESVNKDMSPNPDGVAIYSPPGTKLNLAGTIIGQVLGLPWNSTSSTSSIRSAAASGASTGVTFNILPGGELIAGSMIDLQGGTLTNEGTVEVGAAGKIAQTTVNGSVIQGSGGKLAFDADFEKGQADKLVVNGTMQLGGALTIRAATLAHTPVTLIEANQFVSASGEALSASGTPTDRSGLHVSDTAVAPVVTTSTHLFSYTPQVQGSSLVVTPEANFVADKSLLNTNQNGLTQYLQKIWDGGQPGFGTSFAQMDRIATSQQYADTVKRLTGEGVNAINTMRLFASYNLVSDLQSCQRVNSAPELREDECAWTRLGYTGLDRSRDSEFAGYDMDMLTAEAGFRREVSPDWFVGMSGAYEHSNLHTNDNLVQVEGNSALAAVSLMHRMGAWRVSVAADGSYGWYSSKRYVGMDDAIATVAGSPNGSNLGLHGRVSYDVNFESFYLRPQLDLETNWLRMGSDQEHGSALFELTTESSNKVVFSGTPALEIGTGHALKGGGMSRVYAVAGATFFANTDWTTLARFTAAPADAGTFRTDMNNPNVAGRFGLGAQVQMADRWDVGLEYDAHVASHILAHTGVLRVNYHF